MYRIAIGDDDPVFLTQAQALIERCMDAEDLKRDRDYALDTYPTVPALLDALDSQHYSLYLLDVTFGGENGLDLGAKLRASQRDFSLVYISAHREYVFDSFDTHPLSYLLKPLEPDRLAKLLREDYRRQSTGERLYLHAGGKHLSLAYQDIWAAEAAQHRVVLYLDQEQLVWSGTLSALMPELPSWCFCRCHNSYIINFSHVTELKRYEARLDNGTVIPVSKRLYKTAIQQYFSFLKH